MQLIHLFTALILLSKERMEDMLDLCRYIPCRYLVYQKSSYYGLCFVILLTFHLIKWKLNAVVICCMLSK